MDLFVFDIPSKGRIDLVADTLEFIHDGRSYSDLGEYIGEDKRHGHFLYQNATILGFAKRGRKGAYLTKSGQAFLDATDSERKRILNRAILSTRILSALIEYKGSFEQVFLMTEDEIATYLLDNVLVSKIERRRIAHTTARRRASSVMRWIEWANYNV